MTKGRGEEPTASPLTPLCSCSRAALDSCCPGGFPTRAPATLHPEEGDSSWWLGGNPGEPELPTQPPPTDGAHVLPGVLTATETRAFHCLACFLATLYFHTDL